MMRLEGNVVSSDKTRSHPRTHEEVVERNPYSI